MKPRISLLSAYILSSFIIPILITLLIGCTKTYKDLNELKKSGVESGKLMFIMSEIAYCSNNDMGYYIEKESGSYFYKVICKGDRKKYTVYSRYHDYEEDKKDEEKE